MACNIIKIADLLIFVCSVGKNTFKKSIVAFSKKNTNTSMCGKMKHRYYNTKKLVVI